MSFAPNLNIEGYVEPPLPGLYFGQIAGVSTQAALEDLSDSANTTGKAGGVKRWDSTNLRVVVASGGAPSDIWNAANGSGSITPGTRVIVAHEAIAFTGQDVAFALSLPVEAEAIAFTGQSVNLIEGFGVVVDAEAIAFTGQDVGFGVSMAVSPEAIAFTGQSVTLTGPGISSCTLVLQAENSDVSVVVPSGVEAGDLMIVYNRSSQFSTPTKVIPSGFTEILSDSSPYRRITTSYKIATGSEDGSTLTGQSSLDDTIMLAIFRANLPITGVAVVGIDTSGITDADPAAQALAAADATAPALAVAVYSSSGVVDPATFSTTADGTFVDATGTRVIAWEFQTSLADITVDMDDEGDANDVAAFWLNLS